MNQSRGLLQAATASDSRPSLHLNPSSAGPIPNPQAGNSRDCARANILLPLYAPQIAPSPRQAGCLSCSTYLTGSRLRLPRRSDLRRPASPDGRVCVSRRMACLVGSCQRETEGLSRVCPAPDHRGARRSPRDPIRSAQVPLTVFAQEVWICRAQCTAGEASSRDKIREGRKKALTGTAFWGRQKRKLVSGNWKLETGDWRMDTGERGACG